MYAVLYIHSYCINFRDYRKLSFVINGRSYFIIRMFYFKECDVEMPQIDVIRKQAACNFRM